MVSTKSLCTCSAALLVAWSAALGDTVNLTPSGDAVLTSTATAPPTVELWLQGQPFSPTDSATHGLSISVRDDVIPLDATNNLAISVGNFTLRRPHGAFFWNHAAEVTTDPPVTIMELNNDHSLTLHNPDAAANGAYSITLKPGAPVDGGGLFYNDVRLLTSTESAMTLGGGSISFPSDLYLDPNWLPSFYGNGTLAAGSGANAFGTDSVALGTGAMARYSGSQALGNHAVAEWGSTAIGNNAYAFNHSLAVGDGAHAMNGNTYAFGPNSYSYGVFSVAINGLSVGPYSIAIGGATNGQSSFAAAWGQSDGYASIALGGSAFGYKSFAANSGYAAGDYSTSIGRGTIARRFYQTALGTYNLDPYYDPANWGYGSQISAGDLLFIIGNGTVDETVNPPVEHRSNAFSIDYTGNTKVAGALAVDGGPAATPVTSVFQRDVSVRGVLRVPAAGDLSMGDFTDGTQP